jgi:hypothetical protein
MKMLECDAKYKTDSMSLEPWKRRNPTTGNSRYMPAPQNSAATSIFSNEPYEEDTVKILECDAKHETDSMSLEPWRRKVLQLMGMSWLVQVSLDICPIIFRARTLKGLPLNTSLIERGASVTERHFRNAWITLFLEIVMASMIHTPVFILRTC